MNTGRIIVVTGAAGGIGRPIAERFLANGDRVIATDRDESGLSKLAANERLTRIIADVSSEEDCERVAHSIHQSSGRVDVLVNVAGWFPIKSFEDMSPSDFRDVVDVNLTGTFLMIRSLWPLMKGRGWGRIIITGSASTFEGVPDQVHYVAAKSGLFGLARSLARTFGNEGVTVNVVTPGLTSTPAAVATFPAQLIEQSVQLRAIQRDERADDLVGPVFFLASDDAGFVTGQTINVDGGVFML